MNLSSMDIQSEKLIVLTGISGSGKSAAIQYILEQFEDIKNEGFEWIVGDYLNWQPRYEMQWLLVDEVIRLSDLWRIRQLLKQGHHMIIASHLPVSVFMLACMDYKGLYIKTDGRSKKLERYMKSRGITYSIDLLDYFVRRYGQSYNTLDVVLNHRQVNDLGMALKYFERHCQMSLSRP